MSESSNAPLLSVVIPAFNEDRRLAATLKATLDYLRNQDYTWDVTVVDDGSTDKTCEVVDQFSSEDPRVRLLRYVPNRGKGYAVRLGLSRVQGKFRLFMDADNSTAIDQVEAFLPLLMDQTADIVIGSRRVVGAQIVDHQPLWKEIFGNLGGLWIRFWAIPGITDTQAGFKAFRGEVVDDLFSSLTLDGWGFDVEVLAVARLRGYKIFEQPIHWNDDPDSKVRLSSYFGVLREVLQVHGNIRRDVYSRKSR